MSASPTPSGLSPSALVEAVLADLVAGQQLAESSLVVYADEMDRFASFCERGLRIHDASLVTREHAALFVHAPKANGHATTISGKHAKRAAVRLLFREGRRLGLVSTDPTLDLRLPPRTVLRTRPLTDGEDELGRVWSFQTVDDLRLPMAWGLGEAGARASEIPAVRFKDVDLTTGAVFIAGGQRTNPRWAVLTDWGRSQVERRLRAAGPKADPETSLVMWDRPPTKPTHAAGVAIGDVLKAIGIHGEPDVRPMSLVAWAGSRMLRDGAPIEQVALALGCRSLDATADIIDFRWRATEEGGEA